MLIQSSQIHLRQKCSLLILGVLALILLLAGAPAAWGQFGDSSADKPIITPRQKAALIKLYGDVDDVMFQSLQRRVDLARKQNCDVIILDIDTYGGLVTSAMDISRYIKNISPKNAAAQIPVIAYVHYKAISAGVIVSFACDHVLMAPDATIGDCEPIEIRFGGEMHSLDPGLRAKLSSPVLEDLRDSAARNHYNFLLLEAMVRREQEIWVIRNNIDIKEPPHYVGGEEKKRVLAELNKQPDGKVGNAWLIDPTPLDDAQHLLTVSTDEAVSMGLARSEVKSEDQLRALCNIRGDMVVMDFNWAEEVIRWISSFWVRAGLFFLMLVLAYIEFSHPGIVIAGAGALVCLFLVIGAPYLTGLAQVWEIILIVLGAGIIVLDLVLYGGIGLFAVPGFLLLSIGLVASFVPADPSGYWIPRTLQSYTGLQHGLSVLVFGSLAALITFYFLSKYLYLTPGFRKLQLAPASSTGPSSIVKDAIDRPAHEAVFVGALGQAVSHLRPAGKAKFDKYLIDVVSDGQFIPIGATVVVIETNGPRVVVRPQPITPASLSPNPEEPA